MLPKILLWIDFLVVLGLALWLILGYQKRKRENRKNYYLKLQKSLMEEHYMALDKQIMMTRRLRHDLANHIQTLESLEERGKTQQYLEYLTQLKELSAVLKNDGFCLNYVLDAMIIRRKKLCEERQLAFETSLLTVDGEGIELTDLMTVFYEMMEYGMKRTEQNAGKSYYMEGNQENRHLFLRLRCPACTGESKHDLRKMICVKLQQTRSIADKYDGELHGELEGGWEKIYLTMRQRTEEL
ncbi:MAG: hypothetical protein ACOYBE_07485 [Blautia sp.]|jgi:cytochrome c-type biogenesis protein CcmH/NrfF